MLTFIIVYLTIGLALELVIEGKHNVKNIKKYGAIDAVAGIIFMSILTPVIVVYDFIEAKVKHTNKES